MFLQVLYAVVKGLLELDGYVVNSRTEPVSQDAKGQAQSAECQSGAACQTPRT